MKVTYCEKWWLTRRKPVNVLCEDSARQRHENRLPYVALLGGIENPQFIVDVANAWISVDFMDNRQRKYLSYNFKEVEHGRLFLKTAHFWEYENDSDCETTFKLFNFDENGHIVIAERIAATGQVHDLETTFSADENWDRYPLFGEYLSLCQVDRVLS